VFGIGDNNVIEKLTYNLLALKDMKMKKCGMHLFELRDSYLNDPGRVVLLSCLFGLKYCLRILKKTVVNQKQLPLEEKYRILHRHISSIV
jgi:hypothetical protein